MTSYTRKEVIGDAKFRVLDLFSGIGGFSLGLERTGGFETVAFCEIDPFCQKVLNKHWPEVPVYDDITKLTGTTLAADGITGINIITGGFPCQDISLQGLQAGIKDGTRSGLWSEIKRLADELRPSTIILENVSALLGNGMGRVLGDLATIGYDAEWDCIPASFIGAPHERDRVWIVAYTKKINVSTSKFKGSFNADEWKKTESIAVGSNFVFEHEGKYTIKIGGQPAICRIHDGISYGLVQRQLMAYGNTVHPLIPEMLGYAILNSHNGETP